MNYIRLLSAAALTVLITAPAFAGAATGGVVGSLPRQSGSIHLAGMTGPEKCTSLEKQFDGAIKAHAKAAKAKEAKLAREEGGKLCAAGNADQGAMKIEQALRDIGVAPKN
ncbi:MAG: hypothetical protein FJX56_14050 [Alphaproteobacteria bacterium]|nr:hypothetical protein [Alphaproteobacteria bacterium]